MNHKKRLKGYLTFGSFGPGDFTLEGSALKFVTLAHSGAAAFILEPSAPLKAALACALETKGDISKSYGLHNCAPVPGFLQI